MQQSTRLLERYPVSGVLAELEEGVSRNYAQGSPSLDASVTSEPASIVGLNVWVTLPMLMQRCEAA